MFQSMFSNAPEGYWPLQSMLQVLEGRFDSVKHLADDGDNQFYEVEDRGLIFHMVFVNVAGAPDKIAGFAFLCYFKGFDLTDEGVAALNRNLHLSVAERDEDQDGLLLFASLGIKGAWDPDLFARVLDAWNRDLVMTIKMLVPEASIAASLPAAALDMIRRRGNLVELPSLRAEAVAPTDATSQFSSSAEQPASRPAARVIPASARMSGNAADALVQRFLGVENASRSLCTSCGGRGRVGFPRKRCDACAGSGLTAPRK